MASRWHILGGGITSRTCSSPLREAVCLRDEGFAPLILGFMKRTIDDLPLVRVATFVALGEIGRDAKTAHVRFGDDGVEYQLGVRVRRFRNLFATGLLSLSRSRHCRGSRRDE
jgi:hypothetical protein